MLFNKISLYYELHFISFKHPLFKFKLIAYIMSFWQGVKTKLVSKSTVKYFLICNMLHLCLRFTANVLYVIFTEYSFQIQT